VLAASSSATAGRIWAKRAVENGTIYFYLTLAPAGVEAPTGEFNVASA
jgi:hypothetical protein